MFASDAVFGKIMTELVYTISNFLVQLCVLPPCLKLVVVDRSIQFAENGCRTIVVGQLDYAVDNIDRCDCNCHGLMSLAMVPCARSALTYVFRWT